MKYKVIVIPEDPNVSCELLLLDQVTVREVIVMTLTGNVIAKETHLGANERKAIQDYVNVSITQRGR